MKINGTLILYWGLLALAMIALPVMEISEIVRTLFLLAVFSPFFFNLASIRSFPAVMFLFAIIGNNSINASLFPNNPLLYAALSAVLFFLFNDVNRKKTLSNPSISRAILAFLIITFLIDILHGLTVERSFWCFLCVLIFIALTNYSRETKETMFLSIIISSLTLALVFLFNYNSFVVSFNNSGDAIREMWGVANACYYSSIMGFGVLCAGINLLVEKEAQKEIRILDYTTIIIGIIAMGLMASRGGLLSLTVGGLTLFFSTRRSFGLKLVVLLLAIGFIYFLYTNSVFELLMYRLDEGDETGSGRTDYWVIKLAAFFTEYDIIDWFFGVGFLNSCYMGFSKKAYMVAHNDFITSFLAYGLIGLITFLTLFFKPLSIVIKMKKRVGAVLSMTVYLALASTNIQPFIEGYYAFFAYLFYMYVYTLYPQKQR